MKKKKKEKNGKCRYICICILYRLISVCLLAVSVMKREREIYEGNLEGRKEERENNVMYDEH